MSARYKLCKYAWAQLAERNEDSHPDLLLAAGGPLRPPRGQRENPGRRCESRPKEGATSFENDIFDVIEFKVSRPCAKRPHGGEGDAPGHLLNLKPISTNEEPAEHRKPCCAPEKCPVPLADRDRGNQERHNAGKEGNPYGLIA